MNDLGQRLQELRKNKKLSQTELSYALNAQFNLNTDRVMISKWETGFQTPVMKTISCLAKFFNVSLDYLNGNSDLNFSNINSFSENEKNLICNFRQLNDEGQEKTLDYVDDLVQSGKYKKISTNCVDKKEVG